MMRRKVALAAQMSRPLRPEPFKVRRTFVAGNGAFADEISKSTAAVVRTHDYGNDSNKIIGQAR